MLMRFELPRLSETETISEFTLSANGPWGQNKIHPGQGGGILVESVIWQLMARPFVRYGCLQTDMKRFSALLLIGLGTLPAAPAWSWSATGHMTVAQIAYQRLNPAAKMEADRLIGVLAPFDPKADHFVPAATWMDMSRGFDITIFDPLHFISLPYNPFGLPTVKAPAAQNVVWAIESAIATLESDNAADFQQALSLRMLIHFVGDVHQPLHAIERFSPDNPDGELGGNRFLVEISQGMWERFHQMNPGHPSRYLLKRPTNLHAIWDEMGLLYPFVDPMNRNDWSERIPQIADAVSDKHPAEALPEASELAPMKWARESHKAAIANAYRGIRELELVSDAYFERTRAIATRRVALAGYRLAATLNKIWPER